MFCFLTQNGVIKGIYNKILKAVYKRTPLVRQMQKGTNLRLSAAPLTCVQFTTCLFLLATFLLYTDFNTV